MGCFPIGEKTGVNISIPVFYALGAQSLQHSLERAVIGFTDTITHGVPRNGRLMLNRKQSINLLHDIRHELTPLISSDFIWKTDSRKESEECFGNSFSINPF